jgi:hypothetical protein
MLPWRVSRASFYRTHPESRDWQRIRHIEECSVVSLEQRFFYCRIPKAANSTVLASLEHARGGGTSFTRADMSRLKEGTYARPSSLPMTWREVRGSLFTFTVVRHPFTRAVSAFNDKMLDAAGYHATTTRRRVPFAADSRPPEILFDEFLALLERPRWLMRDRHFAPQTTLLAFAPNDLDWVGRVETLPADFAAIGERLFGRPMAVVNWIPHATQAATARKMHVDMLTRSQQERLARIYRADFAALPYDPDSPSR